MQEYEGESTYRLQGGELERATPKEANGASDILQNSSLSVNVQEVKSSERMTAKLG